MFGKSDLVDSLNRDLAQARERGARHDGADALQQILRRQPALLDLPVPLKYDHRVRTYNQCADRAG